ncbi:hypothetical protein C0V77_17500 [Emticicia sp. TH156]|nr:hypothetical protein C0V77_17500 [Emticicia sp. TH156]
MDITIQLKIHAIQELIMIKPGHEYFFPHVPALHFKWYNLPLLKSEAIFYYAWQARNYYYLTIA